MYISKYILKKNTWAYLYNLLGNYKDNISIKTCTVTKRYMRNLERYKDY